MKGSPTPAPAAARPGAPTVPRPASKPAQAAPAATPRDCAARESGADSQANRCPRVSASVCSGSRHQARPCRRPNRQARSGEQRLWPGKWRAAGHHQPEHRPARCRSPRPHACPVALIKSAHCDWRNTRPVCPQALLVQPRQRCSSSARSGGAPARRRNSWISDERQRLLHHLDRGVVVVQAVLEVLGQLHERFAAGQPEARQAAARVRPPARGARPACRALPAGSPLVPAPSRRAALFSACS